MHIGLTYDLQTDPSDERQAEFDSPETLAAVQGALESLGHHVSRLGSAEDLLRGGPRCLCDVDFVFNLAEGRDARCREAWVPTLLDLWNVPYTGSDALALAMGLDKHLCKRLTAAEGLRTPRWVCVEHPEDVPRTLPFAFPAIVKPRYEGSGRGIDGAAIVRDSAALARRVRRFIEQCAQPVLIEEFIPDGELTVFVIGNQPPVAYPAIQRPIDPATRLSTHVVKPAPTSSTTPVVLEDAMEARAREYALTMFRTLGCRDIARVDLRVDARGELYFLEINPLPSFDPAIGLGLLAEYLGTTYAALIGRILDAALARLHAPVAAGS